MKPITPLRTDNVRAILSELTAALANEDHQAIAMMLVRKDGSTTIMTAGDIQETLMLLVDENDERTLISNLSPQQLAILGAECTFEAGRALRRLSDKDEET